jgi:uncharacterized protein YndB with AHSA1/START domain
MTATNSTRVGEPAANQDPNAIELVIVRQFAAPQERVWKALTEPEQLRQWLGPVGMDIELTAGEFQVGRQWSLAMSNPDGMHIEADGEYLAIDPIELLKMTHRWKKDDGTYKPTTTITYKLHTFGDKTTMTFVQSGFWSEEARAAHLGGWDSCLYKLAILLGSSKSHRQLELVREFNAPIELVWNFWTESERLAQWFAPLPYTVPTCELDLRPGGSLYLVMRSPQGDEHPMSSTIVEIEPMSRLGWVSSVPDSSGDTALLGGMTAFFNDLGGGRTRMTVHAYAAANTEEGTFMAGGMEQGWNATLDQMVDVATGTA